MTPDKISLEVVESFHQALHHVRAGGIDGETCVAHDCDGGWIDDYDWDRIPAALVALGWAPPKPA